MPENPNPQTSDDAADALPLTALLEQIEEGKIDMAEVDPAIRRDCVAMMSEQGMGAGEIGDLLGVSRRTVLRDRAEIRRLDAIQPSLHLGDELLGAMRNVVFQSVQRLTRLSNDFSTPPYIRLWAEEAMARNIKRLIDTAEKLNYVRSGSTRLSQLIDQDPDETQRLKDRQRASLNRLRSIMQ